MSTVVFIVAVLFVMVCLATLGIPDDKFSGVLALCIVVLVLATFARLTQ